MSTETIREVAKIHGVDVSRVPHDDVARLARSGRIRAAVALIRKFARPAVEPEATQWNPVSTAVVEDWAARVMFRTEFVGRVPAHV